MLNWLRFTLEGYGHRSSMGQDSWYGALLCTPFLIGLTVRAALIGFLVLYFGSALTLTISRARRFSVLFPGKPGKALGAAIFGLSQKEVNPPSNGMMMKS
jgi:hypothetical protein